MTTKATEATPGPWHYDFDTINGHFFVHDNNARMYVLVRPRGHRERDEIEANARLIAAAPDLLAALQELIDLADEGAFLDLADVDSTPVSRRIRAAISRAVGE